MLSVPSVLMSSVSDDEIAAELAAGLPPDEAAELQAARLHLAALEDEAARSPVPDDDRRSRRRSGDPRDLLSAAARVRPVALAREQLLAVTPELAPLLPDGALRRGSTVAVGGVAGVGGAGGVDGAVAAVGGATTLALALAAAASAEGSWVALVGLPAVGLVAAAELGLALDRLAVITAPPPEQWATVVAALVGAFDLVLVPVAPHARMGEVRRLTARLRERGSVLIQLVPFAPVTSRSGPDGGLEADIRLAVTGSRWLGVSGGAGHLQGRRLTVEASGRRRAARPRRVDLWLPGDGDGDGAVEQLPVGSLRTLEEPGHPSGAGTVELAG